MKNLLAEPIYRRSALRSRYAFGHLLNDMGLTGSAVEIGVHQGTFAESLLKCWKGKRFYGVDPWSDKIEGYDEWQTSTLPNYDRRGDGGLYSNNKRMEDMRIACERLEGCPQQVVLLRTMSDIAAELVPDELDFVYVDGNHESEYVRRDLELWWPKTKSGGVFAGHDIFLLNRPESVCAKVEPVVRGFFEELGIEPIQLVTDRGTWSWYVVKGAA